MIGARLAVTLGAVDYVRAIEAAVAGAPTVLDVGCGNNSPLGRFRQRVTRSVGVDRHLPWIEESRAKAIHDDYVALDVLDIAEHFGEDAFDVALAADVLEHLEPDSGAQLLEALELVASKRVVVLTPNGYVPQEATWGNPYQVHRSGWSAAQLRDRGYGVRGVNGLKVLRGERGSVRFRPRRLWGSFAAASQPLAWRRPEWAFHILAVKDVSGDCSGARAHAEQSTPKGSGRRAGS